MDALPSALSSAAGLSAEPSSVRAGNGARGDAEAFGRALENARADEPRASDGPAKGDASTSDTSKADKADASASKDAADAANKDAQDRDARDNENKAKDAATDPAAMIALPTPAPAPLPVKIDWTEALLASAARSNAAGGIESFATELAPQAGGDAAAARAAADAAGAAAAAFSAQMAANAATNATPEKTAQAQIPVPVNDPGFGDAVADTVRLFTKDDISTAEIRITPEDLGPVQIRISVKDGRADISFIAPTAEARTALDSALPKLERSLADAGIQLGQASVGGGDARQPQDAQSGRREGGGIAGVGADAQGTAARTLVLPQTGTSRLLDTYA